MPTEFSDRQVSDLEIAVTHRATAKAQVILVNAVLSAQRFLEFFTQSRQGARGTTTDGQQDLLRSMLVFTLAGLDSTVKQLVREAVPLLCATSESTEKRLQEFAVRRLQGRGDPLDLHYLVTLLRSRDAHDALVEDFILDVTNSSMQSVEQILSVCEVLGIRQDRELERRILALRETFAVRNRIAHEMDVDLGSRNRNRISRPRAEMVRYANRVFDVGGRIVSLVDARLADETAH